MLQLSQNILLLFSAWIIRVIVAILLAGIIMLLTWKVFTTLHDRREYASFLDNTKKEKWARNEINPLYKDAHTTFENPTFGSSGRSYSVSKKS